MQVIKSTTYGVLLGLATALAMLIGLYASPLRQDVYFAVDPQMAQVRANLRGFQEWLTQADLRIAQSETGTDSLRTLQAKAWRDYKGWRTKLGELSRAHAQPTAAGLPGWLYSVRYWAAPFAGVVVLLPALFGAWSARSRYRPARTKPGKSRRRDAEAGDTPARSKAVSDFEEAVKKVARISRAQEELEGSRQPGAARDPMELERVPELPPTDALPISALSRELEDEQAPPIDQTHREPDTVPFSMEKDKGPEPEDTGRETRYFQVGPGWGEAPPADARPARPGLAMEDEDAPASASDAGIGEETLGVMPPTTEVERVERRKEEVLKLARKGLTSSEISRRMRISQDQVEFIIRLRREKG